MAKKLFSIGLTILVLSAAASAQSPMPTAGDSLAARLFAAKASVFSLSPYSPPAETILVMPKAYADPGLIQDVPPQGYAYPQEPEKHRPWVAVGEAVGINVFVWALGMYALDGEHAYINLDTMRDNLTYWFEWDVNNFVTNFFAHPYHGGLYYNAGRANGLDYWSSTFVTFGGSLMWEMVMERHRPAINDLIMTTTGGMFVGEMMYRFSSLVLDDSATGFERVWRELAGFVIDPVRGFNRLLHGETSRVLPYHNQLRMPVNGTVRWAGALISRESDLGNSRAAPSLEVVLSYGDPFTGAKTRKPLDFFTLQGSAHISDQAYWNIYAYGLLLGKELASKENQDHLIGLFQHYDFIYSEQIRLGGTSFCAGAISRFILSPKVRLELLGHLGWMMMGASQNDYVEPPPDASQVFERDYNYGMGYTAKVDAVLQLQKFGRLILRWAHYKLYTLEGAEGTNRLNLFQGLYRIPLWKSLGAGVQYTQYRENSVYDEFPDVKQKLFEWRASLSLNF
jgi:hypothetical protein